MGTKEMQLGERIVKQVQMMAEEEKKPARGRRIIHNSYTDDDKAAAPAYLRAKGGPISEAEKGTGVAVSTMTRSASGRHPGPKVAERYGVVKETLSAKLEGVAYQMIEALLGKIEEASLKDTAATLALLIDKMRLLKEEPAVISKVTDRRELIELAIKRTMQRFPGRSREEIVDEIRHLRPELIKFLD